VLGGGLSPLTEKLRHQNNVSPIMDFNPTHKTTVKLLLM